MYQYLTVISNFTINTFINFCIYKGDKIVLLPDVDAQFEFQVVNHTSKGNSNKEDTKSSGSSSDESNNKRKRDDNSIY